MDKQKIRETITRHAVVTLSCDVEDDGPEAHFAYETDEENRAAIADIHKRMESSVWAWCVAIVEVRFGGLCSTQYLGACSYDSAEDFRRDRYYAAMVSEGIDDLVWQVCKIEELLAA